MRLQSYLKSGGFPVVRSSIQHFAAGVIVSIVAVELLIESHESANTSVTTTMFFVGFLIFLLLGMVE